MIKYIDKIIIKARNERKLSQKTLVNNIGEHLISLRTLRRIENGERVTEDLINVVLDYFELKLIDLLDQVEDRIFRDVFYNSYDDITLKDCLEEICGRIEEYRVFFHNKEYSLRQFHIANLADFIIYYPLMNKDDLDEAIGRIGGNIYKRYYYVLEQLDYVYNNIPDSDIKRIADLLSQAVLDGKEPENDAFLKYSRYITRGQ